MLKLIMVNENFNILDIFSYWKYAHGVSGIFLAPEGVELRPRRSQEVRGSPELQNGGLRALEDAWMTNF